MTLRRWFKKIVEKIGWIVPLGLIGCTAAEAQTAIKTIADIADDVNAVAQVLCLADHAKHANARAITVKDLCKTEADLAPYIEAAKNTAPKAACAK